MSLCSHALYLALTQDLQRYIPNSVDTFDPFTGSEVSYYPGMSVKEFAASALTRSIFKKFEDNSSESADNAALSLFISMNNKCKSYSFPDLWSLPDAQLQVFSHAKNMLHKWLSSGSGFRYSIDDVLSNCDFGPGASVGSSGTSFYHKAGSSRLTQTSGLLYSMYMESIRTSRTWIEAEKLRRDLFGRPDIVSGSKLCFVPKSAKISRVICVEPSLNMFIQKGLGSCLEHCLRKSIGFDLSDQQFRNKRLARIGSVSGTMSTIDLSSASDTISLALCDALLPPEFLEWLLVSRSPMVTLPDGSERPMHMISSMGNAVTFPLQTMIFTALALGCYRVLGLDFIRPGNTDGNLGVFGDDIVCLSESFDLLISVLETSGFIPNKSKSFNTGLFRESCGGDYFDGHYVRGVYCKTLRTTHGKYSLINRLNVWSANNGIPLPRCISYLMSDVRFLPVPIWDSDIAGVKVPLSLARVKRDRNGSFKFKRLEARSLSCALHDVPLHSQMKRFRIIYNPSAILLAAVKGTLRNGSLNIRLDVVRPHYRFAIAPCWDYVDLGHSLLENGGLEAWKQATLTNFGSSLF
jgi:hypothetical protein